MKNRVNTALVTLLIFLVLMITSATLGLFWVLTDYQDGAVQNHIEDILDR